MQNKQIQPPLDQKYLQLLSDVEVNPIFILGDHRSGTTLLYKTLVDTGYYNYLNAYHIIKYEEIVSNFITKIEHERFKELEKKFISLGIKDRSIDDIIVTPNLPEEYGFILQNICSGESFITPDNIHVFQELSKKIQFISDLSKPLLLKNPWDFTNFMYINKEISNSKFIFIHRHPIHVINSKLKAARTILSTSNEYTALISKMYTQILKSPLKCFIYKLMYAKEFQLGLRRVTQQSIQSTNYFLRNVISLSNADFISVRYEDLCKNPENAIHNILIFSGLDTKINLKYDQTIKPRTITYLPEVKQHYYKLYQKLSSYCKYHRYTAEVLG